MYLVIVVLNYQQLEVDRVAHRFVRPTNVLDDNIKGRLIVKCVLRSKCEDV